MSAAKVGAHDERQLLRLIGKGRFPQEKIVKKDFDEKMIFFSKLLKKNDTPRLSSPCVRKLSDVTFFWKLWL